MIKQYRIVFLALLVAVITVMVGYWASRGSSAGASSGADASRLTVPPAQKADQPNPSVSKPSPPAAVLPAAGGQTTGTVPAIASAPDYQPAPRPPEKDRFARHERVNVRTVPLNASEVYRYERLLRREGKYPLIRVVERVHVDPKTGAEEFGPPRAMVADHVIVRLREGADRDALATALAPLGFSIRRDLRAPRSFLIAGAPVTLDTVPALTNTLSAMPAVELAEPDYLVFMNATTPNDPSYSNLWGMEKIGMPSVWDATTGTGGIVVAIFDTGIDLSHPDLADNLWTNPGEIPGNGIDDDDNGCIDDIHGYDFHDSDNDPADGHGHGSHVAGTIGAVGNNNLGVAGVNWRVRIMPIKIFTDSGLDGGATVSAAMEGLYYVRAHRMAGVPVRVTNHSWGGGSYSQLLRDAFELAGNEGMLHMVAAGNKAYSDSEASRDNDNHPHYPSSFTLSNIVAIAWTTETDSLSGSSHYGATSVDLAAPGSGIYSTGKNSSYRERSGTSMATPHVAGVAALLWEYAPYLDPHEVRQALFDGVDTLSSLDGHCVTEGRLNAIGVFDNTPPRITHMPLPNTTDVYADHIIEAHVSPALPFTPTNGVTLNWNTTGDTNALTSIVMQHVSNGLFRATIPAQSRGTAIYYMIGVETRSGTTGAFPADAPATLHQFDVTYPVDYYVYGIPEEYGTPAPDYGSHSAPWGSSVTIAAPPHIANGPGYRNRCSGWYGAGSVPAAGTSNAVTFVMREKSAVAWIWDAQVSLTQTSAFATVVNTQTWWNTGGEAHTVTAPSVIENGGTVYRFVHWLIDGARFPDGTNSAVNPVVGLAMPTPQQAEAVYWPDAQDSDADGLPDWWEMTHFGNLSTGASVDMDDDGFSNDDELADGADPNDPASQPGGPHIVSTPVDDPAALPAPWPVSAQVTDISGIAGVQLVWRRNGGNWTNTPMTRDETGLFQGQIQTAYDLGDTIGYRLEAADTLAYASTTSVYQFNVAYPVAAMAVSDVVARVPPAEYITRDITLTNIGNARLQWQVVTNWIDTVSDGTSTWTHAGANDLWHISTQKVYSGTHAWYCGSEETQQYVNLMDASLVTPAVQLGADPVLTFQHWPEMEYDGDPGYEDYYWDGGVVDISTDGGVSFERITPVGGYPYKITPNDDSPFPDHTPCLGGMGGWEPVTFDLAAYAGERVHIRFRFGSDRYTVSRGWFIDDIQFRWQAMPWMVLPDMTGSVAAASAASIPLLLDAGALPSGDYRSIFTLEFNAPTTPAADVSVRMVITDEEPSAFVMDLTSSTPETFVVTWPSLASRYYTLTVSPHLDDNATWTEVPGYVNRPGIDGTMSYTGAMDRTTSRFYRISVTQP